MYTPPKDLVFDLVGVTCFLCKMENFDCKIRNRAEEVVIWDKARMW